MVAYLLPKQRVGVRFSLPALMQYYRCKCGKQWSWGSMPPSPCAKCSNCASDLAPGPDFHEEPLPHDFHTQQVETDNGPQPLSICRWCSKTKTEIDGNKS